MEEDKTKEITRAAILNILEDSDELIKQNSKEKKRYRSIMDNLNDGIIILDKKYQIEFINSEALIFLDLDKREVEGKSLLNLIQKKDLEDFFIKDGEVKNFEKKELIINDYCLLISSLFLSEGFLIIISNASNDKLIERRESDFISIAAHQLRTPLSAIKWTTRMILDGDAGDINEEQRSLLEKTYLSNEKMIYLINDLLDVSKIEENKFIYNKIDYSLEEILNKSLKRFKDILEIKNINLKIHKPDQFLPKVKIDKSKMEIVFQKLIENAIKYSLKGGEISITLEKDDKNVIFKIKDYGAGIPKDQQERIFSKFFRGSNAVKLETDGTGLGLYTTKSIINSHKGKIWFESVEGEGTTFYFTIPIN